MKKLALITCSAGLLLTGCTSSPSTVTSAESAAASSSVTASPTPTPAEAPAPADTTPAEEPGAAATAIATEETSAQPTVTSLTPPVNDGYTIDPTSIVTTEIAQGSPVAQVEAYRFADADQPSVVFQTPNPQVACLMQTYGVFCMTDDSVNWVLQSVSMGPGDTLPRTVQARGRAATHDWFKTNMVLPEGSSISWMGMTCTTTAADAVQCSDGVTGFNLSDANGR